MFLLFLPEGFFLRDENSIMGILWEFSGLCCSMAGEVCILS
jgi:hypothetical protein